MTYTGTTGAILSGQEEQTVCVKLLNGKAIERTSPIPGIQQISFPSGETNLTSVVPQQLIISIKTTCTAYKLDNIGEVKKHQ